jgi:hypothetical protein
VTATARRRGTALTAPADGLRLEAVAREAGVHPELVRRLVAVGLLDALEGTSRDRPLLRADAAARIALAVRLRRDLGLNYAGALLACSLLDRIEQLELRLRRYEAAAGQWR